MEMHTPQPFFVFGMEEYSTKGRNVTFPMPPFCNKLCVTCHSLLKALEMQQSVKDFLLMSPKASLSISCAVCALNVNRGWEVGEGEKERR